MFSFKHMWIAKEGQTRGLRVFLAVWPSPDASEGLRTPTAGRLQVFYSSRSLGIILNSEIINLWALKQEILSSFP